MPFHHYGLERFCDLVILTSCRLFSRLWVTKARCGFPALSRFQDETLVLALQTPENSLLPQLNDKTVNAQDRT